MKAAAILAATLSCCLWAPHAAAQTDDKPIYDSEGVVRNACADPARCNLRVARRIGLLAAARRVDTDYGQCIAIPAYVGNFELFATRLDRALARSSVRSPHNERIGFYARNSVSKRALRHPRTRFWVVGKLSECGRAWPEATVMGYCHYTASPAPIMIVAEMRPDR